MKATARDRQITAKEWAIPLDRAAEALKPAVRLMENGHWLVPAEQRPKGWQSMPVKEQETTVEAVVVAEDVKPPKVKTEQKRSHHKRVTATERVEETRVTERSVTTEEETLPTVLQEPVDIPPLALEPLLEEPTDIVCISTPRPESYLPKDGEIAKQVLDLHYELALVDYDDDWKRQGAVMDKLWEIQDGIKRYRDAKTTTDSILKPWLQKHFDPGWFSEETFADIWKELFELVHGALLAQAEKVAEHEGNAVRKANEKK